MTKMDVPESHIDEMNRIIENIEYCSAPELYIAYKQLSNIYKIFDCYNLHEYDGNVIRLRKALQIVDRKLIRDLDDYERLRGTRKRF